MTQKYPHTSSKFRPITLTSGRDGFTLIELLTVIAIIAILAAIVIPVIGVARATAQSSQCASNLRAMQMANQMYAAQNKGRYLPVASFNQDVEQSGEWPRNAEYFEILASMSRDGMGWGEWEADLLCPTRRAMGDNNAEVLGSNYGIAYQMFYRNLGLPEWGTPSSTLAVTVHTIKKPGEAVAFADCSDWLLKTVNGYTRAKDITNDGTGPLAFRHKGGTANVVNFDASVDTYTQDDMSDPKVLSKFTLDYN